MLQAELEERLVAARFYKPEKRDVLDPRDGRPGALGEGRLGVGGGRGKPMRVESPPEALPAELTQPFEAPSGWRSTARILRPSGAEYVPTAPS